MKVPISARLLLCASMVPKGARVADIGTDHGYLGIYLLKNGLAEFVTASDLRPDPLQNARMHAAQYGTTDRMDFVLSDGLQGLTPETADTLVMAGMGGDLMVSILSSCSWVRDARFTLILQPQSAGNALRAYLAEAGYSILEEQLTKDGAFFYTVMKMRFGGHMELTPAQQYLSPKLLESGSGLLEPYCARLIRALEVSVEGLRGAEKQRPERLSYFEQALEGLKEMQKTWQV